jgi:hypothetical protein
MVKNREFQWITAALGWMLKPAGLLLIAFAAALKPPAALKWWAA